MSANANVFALLDDEGTTDAGVLAAKIPVAQKDAPVKTETDSKQGARSATTNNAKAGKANGTAAKSGRSSRGGARDDTTYAEDAPAEGRSGGKTGGKSRSNKPRDGERPRKRDFDRHDATGRGHETEKRHGAGRGNWGTEGDDEAAALNELAINDDEATEEVQEEPEKQLSLEEYEAQLAEKRAALNTQRAAAKVDDAQFQGMKTFEKKEEDVGLELVENVKIIGANKAGRDRERKEKEAIVDLGFRIQSEQERPARSERSGGRGGRGRGGRGSGRRNDRPSSGRNERSSGRGGGRGGRGGGSRIDVGDTSAFPSLG